MNILERFEKKQLEALRRQEPLPAFQPGDTLKVWVRIKEGDRERQQVFEGVCIARKRGGINASFTVRKISYGEGVERLFPLHSPNIAKVEVLKRGDVRRAKLYYLRERSGKSARIAEKRDYKSLEKTSQESPVSSPKQD